MTYEVDFYINLFFLLLKTIIKIIKFLMYVTQIRNILSKITSNNRFFFL